MDPRRFDEISRGLAHRVSRRALLAATFALPLTATGVAAKPRPRREVCRPFGVGCTRSSQCCSGHCETRRDLPRSIRNRCGCPERTLACNGVCIDAEDPENCGACGNVCDPMENCISGICTCGWAGICAAGETCCMGEAAHCTDTASDPWSCGSCGFACSPSVLCVSGVCQEPCGNRCNEQEICKDNQCLCNGVLCPDSLMCWSGMCVCSPYPDVEICTPEQTCVNRQCVDPN